VKIRLLFSGLAVVAVLAGCEKQSPQGASPDANNEIRSYGVETNSTSNLPDNTGVNVRDRNDATLTPGDQGGSEPDRKTTAAIRQSITANDQLSTAAKNIKIITIDGKVTLRGPVNTEAEKNIIDSIVKQAGVASFDNQLEVKPTNP
jgi:hyperosmotically inducible protein